VGHVDGDDVIRGLGEEFVLGLLGDDDVVRRGDDVGNIVAVFKGIPHAGKAFYYCHDLLLVLLKFEI
jgi:hypothetical protein